MMKRSKLILTIISVLLAALLLVGCKWGDDTPPDYPKPPVDTGVETIGEGENKLNKAEGGGAVGLTYMTDVKVSLASGIASLYFINPNRSVDNLSVSIYVSDVKVAESGILEPGNKLTALALNEEGKQTVTKTGIYDGKFVVYFYSAETNEKSVLNTEIPIRFIVNN